jgi:hypothetical protein
MADTGKHRDLMRYDLLTQEALRGVVRQALKRAASEGVPGEHHFYISFQTSGVGVSVPPDLAERYPEEMTIVLQHQFRELAVEETRFSVVLHFGGQPKKLLIPFAAVTRFHDPSVPFALTFEPGPVAARPTAAIPAPAAAEPSKDPEGPKIVSLDQFRKK